MAAQGILKVLKGIIDGKPQGKVCYEEFKEVIGKRDLLNHSWGFSIPQFPTLK